MSNESNSAQVHRFRDAVALYIGTGETIYLTPKDARKFSRAINKAAKSCERERFQDSSGNSQSFTFADGREFKIDRESK